MRVVLTVALLVASCGSSRPRAELPPAGWSVLAPVGAGFSVWVPAPAEEKLFSSERPEVLESRAFVHPGRYIVSFARFEAPIDASDERFAELRDGFLAIPGTTLEDETLVSIRGFPGRLLRFRSAGRLDRLLVVIEGARLLQLQLTNADDETAERFFRSLRLER